MVIEITNVSSKYKESRNHLPIFSINHHHYHHQSVLPKGRSSSANSGTNVAVLLRINRCGSYPLFEVLDSPDENVATEEETDINREWETIRNTIKLSASERGKIRNGLMRNVQTL